MILIEVIDSLFLFFIETFETKMFEKLCLQWNDFKDDLYTAMTNLRKDADFTDVWSVRTVSRWRLTRQSWQHLVPSFKRSSGEAGTLIHWSI